MHATGCRYILGYSLSEVPHLFYYKINVYICNCLAGQQRTIIQFLYKTQKFAKQRRNSYKDYNRQLLAYNIRYNFQLDIIQSEDSITLFTFISEKATKMNYLNAQISVPKLAVSSSSSHCTKHVRIDFNDFFYRLWCWKSGSENFLAISVCENIHAIVHVTGKSIS